MRFVDEHKEQWGIEPLCRMVTLAPSTYYERKGRAPSSRTVSDEKWSQEIARIHADNRGVYGVNKVWASLKREGHCVARCTVERLMKSLGLQGVIRGKGVRTTVPDDLAERPQDLVARDFRAFAPHRLWVADITYVKTHSGWVYVSFITDVYSRKIVGWQASRSLHAKLALDALEMAIWRHRKEDLSQLVHHSDRGMQYMSLRYTQRLDEAKAVRSVGSRGDSYDNALAESVNGLYKAEVIHRRAWTGHDDVEMATLDWVEWYNTRRLHSALGMAPPCDYEQAYHASRTQAKSA